MTETNNNDLPDELEFSPGETDTEIIAAAYNAMLCADAFDYGMCSRTDRKMIDDIREWSLKLIHNSLKNIYEANIDSEA